MKKLLAVFIIILLGQLAFAGELPIKVKTIGEISTSDNFIQEGDYINLEVAEDIYAHSKLYIKKGAQVTGTVTSLVPNGFTCEEASIYVENFKVRTADGQKVNLNGVIYQKGHTHARFTQFITQDTPLAYVCFFIRGGEVKIPPEQNFTLYLEVKDEDL